MRRKYLIWNGYHRQYYKTKFWWACHYLEIELKRATDKELKAKLELDLEEARAEYNHYDMLYRDIPTRAV